MLLQLQANAISCSLPPREQYRTVLELSWRLACGDLLVVFARYMYLWNELNF